MHLGNNWELNETIQRPVLIWGTGLDSVQFTYRIKDRENIIGYIDNNGNYGKFAGKKVLKLSEIKDQKNVFIFFAGTISVYEHIIRPKLWELGLKEFENFLYADWYKKQMVFLHGNCHLDALDEALTSSVEFRKKYFIYPHKMIQEYKIGETVDLHALKHADIFIHEDIRSQNPFGYKVSDEYMLPKLGKGCRNITIPHLYGLGGGFSPNVMDLTRKVRIVH